MSLWDLGLFAVASFLALRSLISLMTLHKSQYKQDLVRQQLQQIAEMELEKAQAAQQQAAPKDDEFSPTAA